MSKGRIRKGRHGLEPGDLSRWSILGKALKRADAEADRLGHWLTLWEIDESLTDNRIAVCRKCDRIAAVDIGEEPYLFGPALHVVCPVLVVGRGAILVAR